MHATLQREFGNGGEARFFAEFPDGVLPSSAHGEGRSAYGATRRPNWIAIMAIALVHIATLYALVKLDVIQVAPKKKPLVVDLIAEPPAPPVEQPKPEPVVVQKVAPAVVTPPPVVQIATPAPPPIAVTNMPPPPPKPVTAPAAAPSGPVLVANLDERLIEGRPPAYPYESRKKKEQGTVVLRVLIGTDGRVLQISIAQSSGHERLDQAALKAARGWRWQPMVRDGEAMEIRGTLSFPFALT